MSGNRKGRKPPFFGVGISRFARLRCTYFEIPLACFRLLYFRGFRIPKPAQEASFRQHGPLFGGESKRVLIVGASGSGKTNIMISLITHPNGLRFSNVCLYCKSPYQPKYQYLRDVLQPLKEIGYFEYTEEKEIIPPNVKMPNSPIIFDNVASCPQDIIRQCFSFGRHRNTDCFYFVFKMYPRRSL
nr:unnamed protein product [Callosobruchus analis]